MAIELLFEGNDYTLERPLPCLVHYVACHLHGSESKMQDETEIRPHQSGALGWETDFYLSGLGLRNV